MKRFENGIEFDSLRERLGFEGMLSSMKECLNNYTKIKKKAGIFNTGYFAYLNTRFHSKL